MSGSATGERIAVFAFDMPFPPHRGGRADVWRRLQGLRQLGHRILLVAWHDPGVVPDIADQFRVREVVDDLLLFPTTRGALDALVRLAMLPWQPSHVANRRLDSTQRRRVDQALRAFSPTIVWSEGIYPSAQACRAAGVAGVHWVYRSHNIEHLYMQRQANAARHWRDRLAWSLACFGLARYERRMLDTATWVYDISCDDMAFWQAAGVQHISWLPPLSESALLPPTAEPVAPFAAVGDVVFLGNLTTPNNVRGVQWLLEQVLPLLRHRQPAVQVVVAGSNPGPFMRNLCARANVTLLANPPDAVAVYRGARVLVNPVQTGSGTHMKAIEMLFTAAPIVTAPQGTCGLPAEVRALFRVADTPEAFAAEIHEALTRGGSADAERHEVRQLFGLQGLERALSPAAVGLKACEAFRRTRSGV